MSNIRNILASFKTIDDAKNAAQELQNNGFKDLQVDQIGKYAGDNLNDITNPVSSNFDSLTDLTLGSLVNKNAEILNAVDVSASGMSDGVHMEINQNVLLTVVTDEAHAKQVEAIINLYNGVI